jgi:acetoin utilization protein AcuB
MRLELVRDWMSRDVITVDQTFLLTDAEKLMTGQTIRRLPVMDNGRLAGIITLSDTRSTQAASQSIVAQIMTPNPIVVSQNATVGEAAQLMLEHRISGLPVVDARDRLVGIITESDIFRLVVRDWLRSADDSPEPFAKYS